MYALKLTYWRIQAFSLSMFRGDGRKKKIEFLGDEVMANNLEIEKGRQDLDLSEPASGISTTMWDMNKDPLNA